MPERRLDQLECMRGIAALVVVGWHLRLGFSMRPLSDGANGTIFEKLFDTIFNGSAAVSFFFVLSGVVLTLGYFRSGNLQSLGRGVLKRWPRLAGACTVVVLASWGLFASGGYYYAEAAALTRSAWLAEFAFANLPTPFAPSWQNALRQGLFTTFYNGENYYDSSLWTMRPEMVGSLLSFGMAPVFRGIVKPWLVGGALISASIMLMRLELHIPSFLIGVMLARCVHDRVPELTLAATAALVIPGLILLTSNGPAGAFSFLCTIIPKNSNLSLLEWDAGSALLIFAAMGSRGMARGLSGSAARWLGRLSFPIYLVHVPVLCSLGAYIYIRVFNLGGAQAALLAASVATLSGTILTAIPLAWFDRWWVRRLNLAVNYVSNRSMPLDPSVPPNLLLEINSPK